MGKCPKNNCGNNLNKALKKIENDSKFKPIYAGPTGPTGPAGPTKITIGKTTTSNPGTEAKVFNGGTDDNLILEFDIPMGPTGPIGAMGPTGPAGSVERVPIRTAYLVTFNDGTFKDGIIVNPKKPIPISYKELDFSNLVNIDPINNTIQFNEVGFYKLTFIISAYIKPEVNFDATTDFLTIGFRKIDTDNVYIGASKWFKDETARQITTTGVVSIENPKNLYELVNLGKKDIYLNSPDLKNIESNSYFTNSLVIMIIEYLGREF